jgi:outer membrane beta-barrel protein
VNGFSLRLVSGAALAAIVAAGLVLPAPRAAAAEPEQVAVRNRYYKDDSRFEIMFQSGLSLANTLTQMYTPALNIAYHIDEVWAIELIAGYAIGGVTSLQAGAQAPAPATGSTAMPKSVFFQAGPPTNRPYNDLPGLWTMNGFNAQIGARWEPVYGKLSLLTALPIHFKWYLDLDAGISHFTRDSLYYCSNYNINTQDCEKKTDGSNTYQTVQGDRYGWLASVGTGMRFIFLQRAALLIGVREYFWYDTYQTGFNGGDFITAPKGTAGKLNKGVTLSLFADLGLSWTF